MKKVSDWKTPASIFITSLITVLTATFKDFLLPKEIWNAIFVLIMFISCVFFLVNFIRALINSKKNTVENLIKKIANIDDVSG
jgi:c-di-AMP phosphodiesterase-like protein